MSKRSPLGDGFDARNFTDDGIAARWCRKAKTHRTAKTRWRAARCRTAWGSDRRIDNHGGCVNRNNCRWVGGNAQVGDNAHEQYGEDRRNEGFVHHFFLLGK